MSSFVLRCVLVTLVVGIAIVLVIAPKPWQHAPLSRFEDYVLVYSWWAGLVNLIILALLAFTARWWMRLAVHLQEVPATAPARVFAVPCWGDDGMCITGPSTAWPEPLGG